MNQFLAWNEYEELTHSQQQPQDPNAHKKKPTVRYQSHNALSLPMVSPLQAQGLN